MDPETDDTYVSKTLESLRRRAQEQLTAADGPFPLAEEEVEHFGTSQRLGVGRYLCYQKGPNSLTCHTLPEFFSDSFARHTDKDFLASRRKKRRTPEGSKKVYEGDRFTYGETLDIAVALSRTLAQTYGVQRGLGLAQARRLTEEWVFTLIAVNGFLSAVSLPVNAWWTGTELKQYGLEDSQTCLLVADLERLDRDRAMLMYTSGTTAMPRLGEKLVMMYKWDAGRALKLIEDEKVQAIVGVPTNTYDLAPWMVNHPDFKKYDTSSMVGVGGGGAAFAAPMIKRVKDTFQNARASTGYGLTETNAVSVVMPAELFPARPTSCGLPAVNVNVCILDENNHKLPPGGVGEICFRGATIMKEYWRKPDKTSEVFHIDEHGQLWFRSGDIGALDEQNFVYILDRAKDIIIRGGENISCAEVEQAIFEHPTVAEVAAIGLPHENLGETVAVAVVFKTGSSAPDAEELREHAASLLPRHMVPSDVFVWKEALPRGATGKIQKRDIREEITKSRKERQTPPSKL
ncbi:Long-chain-fatty-acid--CoA ligase (Long-chain acyl-CoA synthetase) [Durusdinium trenchii]|uniref:Long-chain-fatty-acid--CoA ligase (Long-chain acyl-CoA synthetase) n=1 Tax=Durusdinium trenchii TaxID=1381693 RepID=A0ABP0I275_9DINO